MSEAWRSFWLGSMTAAAIAIVAGVVLSNINPTAGEAFSTSSTRL